MSISKHLLDAYQIHVRPGAKTCCHMCHSRHKTLSIRRDDTLAKCFRCGHYLLIKSDGLIFDSSKQEKMK